MVKIINEKLELNKYLNHFSTRLIGEDTGVKYEYGDRNVRIGDMVYSVRYDDYYYIAGCDYRPDSGIFNILLVNCVHSNDYISYSTPRELPNSRFRYKTAGFVGCNNKDISEFI